MNIITRLVEEEITPQRNPGKQRQKGLVRKIKAGVRLKNRRNTKTNSAVQGSDRKWKQGEEMPWGVFKLIGDKMYRRQ